jgi:Family of unknown function (DUF6152)
VTILILSSKLKNRRKKGLGNYWRTIMENRTKFLAVVAVVAGLLMISAPMFAHHGSGISYDLTKPWTTKATIVDFKYINPHPLVLFDRVNEKGEVEHWHSEIITNPSNMIRNGWGKIRSEEALKTGTKVTLTVCTAKAGGQAAVITKIINEAGEEIITRGGNN